jgi:hypothetical protein
VYVFLNQSGFLLHFNQATEKKETNGKQPSCDHTVSNLSSPMVCYHTTTLFLLLFLFHPLHSVQLNRLRTKSEKKRIDIHIQPGKFLLSSKDTTSGGYITNQGDPKGTGIPVGTKHVYPYGADCYNVNNVILQGRADAKNGPITYNQSCVSILIALLRCTVYIYKLFSIRI